MKFRYLRTLVRILLLLLGAGVGAALAAGGITLFRMASPDREIELMSIMLTYLILCTLFFLISLFFSRRLTDSIMRLGQEIFQRVERLPIGQFVSAMLCMILGLIVAALLNGPIHFMGSSIFTTALSALLTITLGSFGYVLGLRRGNDVLGLLRSLTGFSSHSITRRRIAKAAKKAQDRPAQPYLLDASVLIDGRIQQLAEKGFIRGPLLVPAFVVNELSRMADSADPVKRDRASRGMDRIHEMQHTPNLSLQILRDQDDVTDDTDVMILRLSRELHAPVITCDTTLTKASRITDTPALNLHELAALMRPSVVAGDHLSLQIMKEGRERQQGIGYTEDGTMVVVEDARNRVGEVVEVEITSSLQTNAGRMIFARPVQAA
ncbi:MAG: TRAM domain-containing protein [Clostridia bacterium]|nr:TRAM domain-containing protein [Clostridia bacterium]